MTLSSCYNSQRISWFWWTCCPIGLCLCFAGCRWMALSYQWCFKGYGLFRYLWFDAFISMFTCGCNACWTLAHQHTLFCLSRFPKAGKVHFTPGMATSVLHPFGTGKVSWLSTYCSKRACLLLQNVMFNNCKMYWFLLQNGMLYYCNTANCKWVCFTVGERYVFLLLKGTFFYYKKDMFTLCKKVCSTI